MSGDPPEGRGVHEPAYRHHKQSTGCAERTRHRRTHRKANPKLPWHAMGEEKNAQRRVRGWVDDATAIQCARSRSPREGDAPAKIGVFMCGRCEWRIRTVAVAIIVGRARAGTRTPSWRAGTAKRSTSMPTSAFTPTFVPKLAFSTQSTLAGIGHASALLHELVEGALKLAHIHSAFASSLPCNPQSIHTVSLRLLKIPIVAVPEHQEEEGCKT